MATYKTYDTVGIREDLQNAIYDISPTTTPFMSTVGRSTAKNTLHEWQTDSLAAVNLANAQVEGADAVAPALTPTTRVGNYTQISDKVVQVSTTDDKVDKAGRSTETAYQLSKASAELKRDMESILLSDQAQSAGGASEASGEPMTARKLGGLGSWVTTNVVDAGAAPMTEVMLNEAVLKAYTEGGEPTMMLVSPANKQVFSTFPGIAVQRYEAPKTTKEAATFLKKEKGAAFILAGGTDLLVKMKLGLSEPDLVVDIKKIPAMNAISHSATGSKIGGAVSGAELGEHKGLCKTWPGVVEATNLIGSDQIQSRATMVGNLCNASPAADSVPAMIAAGAKAIVLSLIHISEPTRPY